MNENIAKVDHSPETTLVQFIAALRRILVEFRTDRKGAPGRHADLINNIIVGQNVVKRDVLLFLIDAGMVFKDHKQYIVNLNVMKRMSLSMHSVCALDEHSVGKAYAVYLSWRKNARH